MRLDVLLVPCVTLGLALPILAQSPAVGLRPTGDKIEGSGPGYRAAFDSGGLTFSARSMREGRFSAPMRFALASYGRLGGQSVAAGVAQPQTAGDTVHFARAGVVETYELKSDGVEQSFTFATLPAGSGDLVVRLAVGTDLEPSLEGRRTETLRFAHPERGEVHIGKVTGIDANGARAAGWMSYSGGTLELGLPAEFVDRAALPLVLDPLLAGVSSVGLYGHYPDAAYDETNNLYLLVWQGRSGYFTTSASGIYCQRMRPNGTLLAPVTTLATSTSVGRPKVCNVNNRNTFVVTWADAGTIRLASVAANTGNVVSTAVAGVGAAGDPTIGGVSSLTGIDAILYWNFGSLHLHANTVTVNAGGSITVSPWWIPSYGNPAYGPPSVSRSGGDWRRQLLTWEEFVAPSSSRVRATVVDNLGNRLTPVVTIASSTSTAPYRTAIDGDGTNWVVAYQQATGTSTARGQIRVRPVRLRNQTNSLFVGAEVTLNSQPDGQDPKVAWMGASALVGWSRYIGNTGSPHYTDRFRTLIASVDPFNCRDCETPGGGGRFFDPDTSWQAGDSVAAPALASSLTGMNNQAAQWNSVAAVAWSYSDHGYLGHYNNMDIRATRFRADDGAITSLGGRCANGGIAYTSCARVGNSNLVHRLHDAAPLTQAYLMLGGTQINFPCGPCIFIANPMIPLNVGLTNAFGEAQVTTAIPNNPAFINAQLFEQWWLLGPSTPAGCGLFNLDVSTALKIIIQQ